MAPFLVTFTGSNIEATVASMIGEPAPTDTTAQVGCDPSAQAQGWVTISARDVAADSEGGTVDLLMPHYQPTAYIAGAGSDELLAIAVDQTLVVLWRDRGRVHHAAHPLPSPAIAVVDHESALYVVHEAGVDAIAPDHLSTIWADSTTSWILRPGSPPAVER